MYEQKAINALLGDKNIENIENIENIDFYISNKVASYSSILQLFEKVKNGNLWKKHKIQMLDKIKLKMLTLDAVVKSNSINVKIYNHWIIDVQGAELHILKRAKNSLKYCKSINVEINKKDYYKTVTK